MAHIKIKDLPADKKISKKEMNLIMGGKYIGETEKIVSYLQMELLNAMQMQTRQFQILLNVVKVQQDTEKTTIQNIKQNSSEKNYNGSKV